MSSFLGKRFLPDDAFPQDNEYPASKKARLAKKKTVRSAPDFKRTIQQSAENTRDCPNLHSAEEATSSNFNRILVPETPQFLTLGHSHIRNAKSSLLESKLTNQNITDTTPLFADYSNSSALEHKVRLYRKNSRNKLVPRRLRNLTNKTGNSSTDEFVPRATSTPAEIQQQLPLVRASHPVLGAKERNVQVQTSTVEVRDVAIQTLIVASENPHLLRIAAIENSDPISSSSGRLSGLEDVSSNSYELFSTPQANRKTHPISSLVEMQPEIAKRQTKKTYSRRKPRTKSDALFEKFISDMNTHYEEIHGHQLCIQSSRST